MAMVLDLGEVSISSGSMSHTFHPLTGCGFSSSLSRRSVPCGSVRALAAEKSFASLRGDKKIRTMIINMVNRCARSQPLCDWMIACKDSMIPRSYRVFWQAKRVLGENFLRLRRAEGVRSQCLDTVC